MSRLRSIIVGAGVVAQYHLEAIQAHPERVELVGVVDPDPARIAALDAGAGAPGFTGLDEALEVTGPDLVQLGTPPALHCDEAIASMRAGANVFCEKPLCSSLAEADRLAEVERETDRWCVGVLQLRFGSAAEHLAALIESGRLGRFLVGSAQANFYRDDTYYAAPWRGTWRSEVGGATMGLGIHTIDLSLWLLGAWREVSAMIATLGHEIEVDDAAVGEVRFEDGGLLSIVNSTVSPRQENSLRFDFEAATVELRSGHWYLNEDWTVTPREGREPVPWPPAKDLTGDHAAQLGAVLAAIDAGASQPTTSAAVRPTLEFLASFYKAAATGSRVRRGSIGPGDPFYRHQAGTLAAPDPLPELTTR